MLGAVAAEVRQWTCQLCRGREGCVPWSKSQRGIIAIPKSSHQERMAQNIDIFDFMLSDDDMAQIAQLNQHDAGTINFGDPQFVKYLIENYG